MIVKRNKPNVHFIGNVRFIPGLNTITDEQQQLIEKNKHEKEVFDELVKLGVLTIIDKGSHTSEHPFKDKTVKQLEKLIPELLDVSALRAILKHDTRSTVKLLVKEQLQKIDEMRVRESGDE